MWASYYGFGSNDFESCTSIDLSGFDNLFKELCFPDFFFVWLRTIEFPLCECCLWWEGEGGVAKNMSDYLGYVWCNANAAIPSVKEDLRVTCKLRPLTTMRMVLPERSRIVIIVFRNFHPICKKELQRIWTYFYVWRFCSESQLSCLNMTKLEIVPKFQVFNLHLRRTKLEFFF